MGVFCLLVELHWEESAPAACAAGLFLFTNGNLFIPLAALCRCLRYRIWLRCHNQYHTILPHLHSLSTNTSHFNQILLSSLVNLKTNCIYQMFKFSKGSESYQDRHVHKLTYKKSFEHYNSYRTHTCLSGLYNIYIKPLLFLYLDKIWL